jgi:hypothetical protein
MTVPRPFAQPPECNLVVISLVGHYERIAEYLFRDDGLRQYPFVVGMQAIRVRARKAGSLALGLLRLAWSLGTHRNTMVGIPRSNSRAIRLLVGLFPRATCFSYSDGLGDSIHRFFLADSPRYAGHVGFPSLGDLPLLHEIPLAECIEPWGRRIVYDPAAPVLVIAKTPKETTFDERHVARLYARTIAAIGRHRPVLVSGSVPGLESLPRGALRQVGSLMKLGEDLRLSGVAGLPSTAFLTLATRMPPSALHIMRLGCARRHPDAHRRISSMKRTLDRCIGTLLATPGAAPAAGREEHTA